MVAAVSPGLHLGVRLRTCMASDWPRKKLRKSLGLFPALHCFTFAENESYETILTCHIAGVRNILLLGTGAAKDTPS